jgi:hypothetical protein
MYGPSGQAWGKTARNDKGPAKAGPLIVRAFWLRGQDLTCDLQVMRLIVLILLFLLFPVFALSRRYHLRIGHIEP